MNLCGSFGGGGTTSEVEPDRCILVGIDFHGAIVVDLGLGICKHKKRERERKGRPNFMWGKNEKPLGYLKDLKITLAIPRRKALRCGECV